MTSASLAIQPWHFERNEQPSVMQLLERVNRERGHFRDIIDASLQEELVTEGALELSDSDEEEEERDATVDDRDIKHPTTREELYHAKFDMLQKVSQAHNEVMMALDFISLLESKDSAAGKQTMSQVLKDSVPAGSLGTDIWQRMPNDTTREMQESALAHNIRVEALQRSADNILDAAKRLESNVEKETRYWNEVLSVTEGGWNVCRLPGQRHKLGVRFGLSESSPDFSRGGIAALVANEDGAVSLDRGIETKSRVVRVTIRKDDELVGASTSADMINDGEATLDTRIEHARDALFDEELFRELERESRTMLAAGVQTQSNAIVLPLANDSSQLSVHFELVPRDEAAHGGHELAASMNCLATGILYTAKLLLCQSHRDQLKRSSAIPAPLSDDRTERPPLQDLRALLAIAMHYEAVNAINDYTEALATTLHHAGVELTQERAHLRTAFPDHMENAEVLMSSLLQTKASEAIIQLKSPYTDVPLSTRIHIETSLTPECQTLFSLYPSGTRKLVASDLRQVAWESDRIAASLIARNLAGTTEQWFIEEDSAYLHRKDRGRPGMKEVEVVVESQVQMVRLVSSSFDKQWSSSSNAEQDIWQTWKALV